jgi:tetratricopeptide (TPR) repeat protein
MHEATLKFMESKLGPDHPSTLTTRNNLAQAYADAGHSTEAINMHEATLKFMESKLGPDDSNTLTVRNNLAAAYWKAGRLDRSIPLFETTLRLREAKLGPDHRDTLTTQVNLGINYRDAGRPEEGARLMERALSQAQGQPSALKALTWVMPELAAAYSAAGKHAKAKALLLSQLDRARSQFGPADPRTARAMVSLGSHLIQQHKWPEAERILRDCLAIRDKVQPDDWGTFYTRSQLGASLLGQKEYADAERLILDGYEGMKAREAKIPAQGKKYLTEAAERVVQLYQAWGKKDQEAEWRAKLARPSAEPKHQP